MNATQIERRYINVYLDNATLERIDEYRFDNRFVSRTEAIRSLIDIALVSVSKPERQTIRKAKP